MKTHGKFRTRLVFTWAVYAGTQLFLTNHFADPAVHAAEPSSESPFSKPAFAASPVELLELAKACDYDLGSADVEILLDEGRFSIDLEGKTTAISRQIYRCLTRDAFDQYGVVQASWSPWYQDRPSIRARVITPGGEVHTLDQNTIEEIQIPSGQAYVFTDAKLLRAPLPALAIGCVVETEVLTREHRPFSTAGGSSSFQLGSLLAPTRLVNVVLEVPASTPLHYRVPRSDVVPVVQRDEDRQVVTLSLGPVPALLEQLELNLPSDVAPVPLFIFSTAQSWQDVAQEYATIVQQQLAGNDLEELVRSVLGPSRGKETREVAELLLEHIRQRTRFTAVSFGSATIVPQRPQETLVRQYGDCKDLATLYVGLLRAAGIQADVALLNAGSGMDTIPDLPRLSSFDHAIVYVKGDRPLWIDPTSRFSPFGVLPVDDQGRLALVANSATNELVRTPRDTASENCISTSHVITISDTSLAKAATVTTYRGAFAQSVRASLASADQEQRRDWLRQQGLNWFGTDKLVNFSCSEPDDLKSPFQIKAEYDEISVAVVEHPNALAVVPLHEAFEWLPFDLTGPPDSSQVVSPADEAGSKNQRELPLWLPYPVRHEVEYRVVPAPGFLPGKLPDDQAIELGPAKLEATYRAGDGNSVSVRVLFDSGDGRFSAEAVRESRRKIQELGGGGGYQAWQAAIRFEQTAGKHLEAGRLREAVVAYHELLRKYPDESVRHTQFAQAVLQLGLGDLARAHARRAVELAPTEFHTRITLGFVLAHNRIGRYLEPGFDRAGAVAAYRMALEVEPDDVETRWELGTLLEYDEQGLLFGNPEFVNLAITEFTAAYERRKDETVLDSLVSAMHIQGRVEDAKKLLEKENASTVRDLHLLVAIAASESVDACLKRAAEMRPAGTQRQMLLQQLLSVLSYFREYQAAAELAEKLADNSPQKDAMLRSAKVFSQLSRYEREEKGDVEPVDVVRLVLANAFVHGTASSRLKRFFANVPDETDGAFDSGLPLWIERIRKVLLDRGFLPDRMADSVAEFDFKEVEGGTDCHRVLVKHKTVPSFSWNAVVLRSEQGLRLYRAGDQQSEFGQQALALLLKGRQDDARRWLDWAYDQQRPDVSLFARMFDPFAGTPFARLWAVGNKDQQNAQLAAAALAVMGDAPEKPLAILGANPC